LIAAYFESHIVLCVF